MSRKKMFRWMLIAFMSVMFALTIHLGLNFRRYVGILAEKRKLYITHEKFGWLSSANANELNQLKFKGRKIKYEQNDYVILLVGDSQVESISADFDHQAEKCLERSIGRKNVKVFSIGCSGYGTDQEYIALQEYYIRGYRADMVLLWFTPTNDACNNIFPTHFYGEAKPTFVLDKRGYLVDAPKYYPDIHEYTKKYLPQEYRGFTFDSAKKYVRILMEKSVDDYAIEKTHTQIALDPPSPRGLYSFALTNALLHKIKKLCDVNRSVMNTFFVSLPGEKQFFILNGVQQDGEYYDTKSARGFRISTKTYYANINRCLENIPYYEIHLQQSGIRPDTDMHLTSRGNEEAMRLLADTIKDFLKKN